MTQPIDQAIREAAMRDLDTSFFIEAGAGTGKTTVLVGRVIEIITSGRAEISQVVVLTFTEKAAAELRGRIRKELHDALAVGDSMGHIVRALNGLDAAHIETIHAFASSVLREHPIQSGIDPNFVQLDEVAGDVDFDDRWESWLWSEDPEVTRVLRRCIDLGLRIQEDLRGVAKNFATHREITPRLTKAPAPDPGQALTALRELREEALAFTAHCTKETDQSLTALRRFSDALEQVLTSDAGDQERLVFGLRVRVARGGQANWTDPDAREGLYRRLGMISEEIEGFKESLRRSLTGDAASVLWSFAIETSRQRIAEGFLTFDDLLIEAGRLVREEPEVRRRLQRRYRFFLIDEFQDTDPLQAAMIFHLAAVGADAPTDQWQELDVVPGRLFLVGDPKQSIYRFRRADIAIYATAKDAFHRMEQEQKGARVVSLVQNFRSVRPIIDWVNTVFHQTIVPVPGLYGAQPAYEPIQAARAEVGRGVVHLYPAVPIESERVNDVRAAEAQAIAEMILALVVRSDAVARDENGPLKLSFRDVCILVETRTALDIFTSALTQHGIPFVADSGNLFERQEIRDVAAILRAVDDPSDMTSLVAALKSEAFACSDEELLRYKVSGGKFTLLATPIEHDFVSQAIQQLRRLYDAKAHLGLPAFVDRVVRESFLVEALLLDPGERQRAANLKLITQRARDFSDKGMDSLRPFIRWISSRQELRPRESESQLAETDDDVVRVLTIHGAKGLEFPVVFLAKMGGAVAEEQPQYIVSRDRGLLEFQVGRRDNRFSTPGFEAAWSQEREFQEAEEHRKLYVAATRASDYLVVPVFRSDEYPGKHRYLPMLPAPGDVRETHPRPTIAGAHVTLDRDIPSRPIAQLAPAIPGARLADQWEERRDRVHARSAQGPRFIVPSELGHDSSKQPQETEPLDWDEPEFDRDLESEAQQALGSGRGADAVAFSGSRGARERGVLVHEVLYRCDFSRPDEAGAWVTRICEQRGVLELADEVGRHVERVLASPAMERVRNARRVLKEVPVATFDGSTYLEGIVDLLFEEDDGWVLADYKTDALQPAGVDGLIERYRPQVEAYAQALETAGTRVKQVGLWLTSSGELQMLKTHTEE